MPLLPGQFLWLHPVLCGAAEGLRMPALCQKALEVCSQRRKQSPEFKPLLSIENQLKYLIDFEEGRSVNLKRMKDLNLGLLAVRELEPHDMELADLIHKITGAFKVEIMAAFKV